MDKVTICTHLYAQEFEDFYYNDIKDEVIEAPKTGGYAFTFAFNRKFLDCEEIINIMEDIILEENPIVSASNKIFKIMKHIVFGKKHEAMVLDLVEFFKTEDFLDVEGYMNFRLRECGEEVSQILYCVIKKNLCIEY